jgi:hypothetical protein
MVAAMSTTSYVKKKLFKKRLPPVLFKSFQKYPSQPTNGDWAENGQKMTVG